MASNHLNEIEIDFATFKKAPGAQTCVLLAGKDMALSAVGNRLDEETGGLILKSAAAADFTGKKKTSFEILAPRGLDIDRLVVVGVGDIESASENDFVLLGGAIKGILGAKKVKAASLVAELPEECVLGDDKLAAVLAFGMQLRNYKFEKYKTEKSKSADEDKATGGGKKDGKSKGAELEELVVHCASPSKAKNVFDDLGAIAAGVHLARDLVNEPANTLGPVEFAEHARALEDIGVEVTILGDSELKKLKMGAFGRDCVVEVIPRRGHP